MGYKKIAVIFIGFNTMMLIALIVAGLSRQNTGGGKNKAENTGQEEQTAAVETSEISGNLTLSDVGREVKTGPVVEKEYSSEEYILLVTSVAGDMMIRIMDSSGNLAQGEHFQATITGEAGKKEVVYDDDLDGIIYLDQLKPGRYTVSVGGVGSSSIVIRNIVRVTAVNDIRKIVVDESTIDASKEDTAVNEEAEGETGQFNNSDYNLKGGAIGIDVSKYQKDIDWQKVKASGVEYAIIRAGYRGSSTGVLVKDPYFDKNIVGASEAGIKLGVYFFTQAINSEEAAEEAYAVASLIGAEELDLPVYLDVEGSGSAAGRADGLDIATRTENIRVFCRTLNSLGYKAGFYANKNWLTNKIDTAQLSDYDIWLAQYRAPEPDYQGRYSIWQYTSKGTVDGITGFVDLDLVKK